MCGIAGLVDRGRSRRSRAASPHVASLLRHRGPDDEGTVLLDPRSGAALTLGGADTPREVFASAAAVRAGHAKHGDTARARFTIGLVHRRLAIVDLSPAGHSRCAIRTATLWITYNGEVYNYVELRAELERLGHRVPSSHADTEVVLAAYRQWGPACLDRFNGMFAFAIWDGATAASCSARATASA